MYDADAIEAINFDQLATATDRLLVRGRRVSRRRPGTQSRTRPSQPRIPIAYAPSLEPAHASQLAFERTVPARVSQLAFERTVPAHVSQLAFERTVPAHAPQLHYERTVIIRPPSASRAHVFAVTVVIPTLVGITVGLAALL